MSSYLTVRYNKGMSEDIIDRIVRESGEAWPEYDRVSGEAALRIMRAYYFMDQAFCQALAEHDLIPGEFGVLIELRLSGPPFRLTPTQLYNRLLVTSGGMTGRLDKLEKRDLIRRLPDRTDRRSILVELTDCGREFIDRVYVNHMAIEQRSVGGLDQTEKVQLTALLKKVLDELEQSA